jgi:hypothetical protein
VGVEITALRAINFAQRMRQLDLSSTVMLGRQEIFFTKEDFDFFCRRTGSAIQYGEDIGLGQFSEGLIRRFGCERIDSIDASGYEGASIVADFNRPIASDLHQRYSAFLDFGSIEHIYNVPQVIDNITKLLRPEGTALIATQANGYAGHGFYQFSPEFFYSVFSEQNGFRDTVVFLVDLQDTRMWHLIPEPKRIGRRNDIAQSRSYFIFCLTTKANGVDEIRVQQSDYQEDAWNTSGHSHMGRHGASLFSKARHFFNPFLFQNVRGWYYSRKSLRDFQKESIRFDPDRISRDAFARLKGRS